MAKPVASWLSRAHLQAGGQVMFVRKVLDDEGKLSEVYQQREERSPRWSSPNFEINDTSTAKKRWRFVSSEILDLNAVSRFVDMSAIMRAMGYDVPLEDSHRASVFVDKHGLELIIPDQALIESLFDAPDSSSNRWKHLFRIGVPHILFKVKPDPINLGELCWTLPAAAAKLFPAGYCERIAFFYEEPAAASAVGRCIYHSWSSGQIRLNPIPLKVSQCVFEGQFLGAAFLVNHFRIGPRTFPLQSTHTFTAGGKRLTLHAGPQLEAGEFWLEPSGGHGFQKWAVNTTHPYFEAFEGKMRFRTSRMTANPRTGGAQARRFRELRDLWTREKLV